MEGEGSMDPSPPVPMMENPAEGSTPSQPPPLVECLVCNACDTPICSKDEVLCEQIPSWSSAVYSYPLEDILGLERIWCYSATNPSERRFDVARVSASTHRNGLLCQPHFSPEHTWFPGHEWCMCACQTCGQHMGWGFRLQRTKVEESQTCRSSKDGSPDASSTGEGSSAPSADPRSSESPVPGGSNTQASTAKPSSTPADSNPSQARREATATSSSRREDDSSEDSEEEMEEAFPQDQSGSNGNGNGLAFIGLILTNTAEKLVDPAARVRVAQEATERHAQLLQYQRDRRELLTLLRAMPNQHLANQYGMILLQLDSVPAMRRMMPGLLLQVRAATSAAAAGAWGPLLGGEDSEGAAEDEEEEGGEEPEEEEAQNSEGGHSNSEGQGAAAEPPTTVPARDPEEAPSSDEQP